MLPLKENYDTDDVAEESEDPDDEGEDPGEPEHEGGQGPVVRLHAAVSLDLVYNSIV